MQYRSEPRTGRHCLRDPTADSGFLESACHTYVPRFFVSSQQRFGATDIKALGTSQLSGLGQTMLQLLGKSVLQLHFIYKIAGESKTRREESGVHGEGERERERESGCTWERESVGKRFGSSFYVFFLHLGLPYANWA